MIFWAKKLWSFWYIKNICQIKTVFYSFIFWASFRVENVLVQYSQWRSQNEAEEAMAHPETNLTRFLLVFCILYQFSTLRKTSATDDIIDWPLPTNILGCATAEYSGRRYRNTARFSAISDSSAPAGSILDRRAVDSVRSQWFLQFYPESQFKKLTDSDCGRRLCSDI